jgi:hypothetical protein
MHGHRLDDRCRDCANFNSIPYQYGDPMYGLCYEEMAWRYAGDRASETGCEAMRPRNKKERERFL